MVVAVVAVVIVVATIEIPAKEISARDVIENILCVACMIAHRNNEMIDLIAKYFSTFLHELTVISSLQSNAPRPLLREKRFGVRRRPSPEERELKNLTI